MNIQQGLHLILAADGTYKKIKTAQKARLTKQFDWRIK